MVFAFPLNRRSSVDVQPPTKGGSASSVAPKTDDCAAPEWGSTRRKPAADRDCGSPLLPRGKRGTARVDAPPWRKRVLVFVAQWPVSPRYLGLIDKMGGEPLQTLRRIDVRSAPLSSFCVARPAS